MPKAKTTKQPDNSPFDRSGAGIRAALLFTVVAFLTIALVVVWKQLPKEGESKPKPPIVSNQEKLTCESKGGRWVECASPCAPGEICAQVCVAKCIMPEAATSTPPQVETPEPEPTTPVRERPAGMFCDDLNYICVNDSYRNMVLDNPWTVTSSIAIGGSGIDWRLIEADGNDLGGESYQGGPGEVTLWKFQWSQFSTATGTLMIGTKGGGKWRYVSIPIRAPAQWMTVDLYNIDDSSNTCNTFTIDERRVPYTSKPITAALNVLLWMASENSDGMIRQTNIPKGTKLLSATLNGGVLKLQFSKELEDYGGGSCNVESIRTQIEKTAMQFGNVSRVEITVPGKTAEETLQP